MVNIKPSQLNLLGAGMILALMSAFIAPAAAQRVIVIDRSDSYRVNQPPAVGSFIYGSPIPTPVLVDPTTGLLPSQTVYPNYYPSVRHDRFHDSKFQTVYPDDYSRGRHDKFHNSRFRTVYPDYYPRVRHDRFHNSRFRTVYPDYYPSRVRQHRFHNSITNPVIINNSRRGTPFRGRSRVILINPRR